MTGDSVSTDVHAEVCVGHMNSYFWNPVWNAHGGQTEQTSSISSGALDPPQALI